LQSRCHRRASPIWSAWKGSRIAALGVYGSKKNYKILNYKASASNSPGELEPTPGVNFQSSIHAKDWRQSNPPRDLEYAVEQYAVQQENGGSRRPRPDRIEWPGPHD